MFGRVKKFGGGEKRKSLYQVIFPCYFAGNNVKITTEIVDADFPLLLGNTLLKKAQVVLFLGQGKAIVMGTVSFTFANQIITDFMDVLPCTPD